MAACMKSKVTPKSKTKYRVRNWAAYVESLRRQGDITVWFDAYAVDSWNAPPSGRPRGQREYSDVAIETALTEHSRDDGCVGVELLGRLGAPVASFRANGACDTRAVYASLDDVGMPGTDIAIPSRRAASSSRPAGAPGGRGMPRC